jgi:phosphate transport system protein
MRQGFTLAIRAIETDIETQFGQAVQILAGLDQVILHPTLSRAQAVAESGRRLRGRSREIDVRLVRLSATQAPVACDLRLVLMMMQLVQRQGLIANQFVLIGEQLASIDPGVTGRCATGRQTAELAALACAQLRGGTEAFARSDPDRGEQLARSDDRLNRLNREICRAALEMRVGPEHRELAFRHVLIARSLERIGDNAVSIARLTAELVKADVHRLALEPNAPSLTVF